FSLLHDPSTTDLSPLSLHDALPICAGLEICTDICPSAPYIMVPTGDLPIGNVLSAPFVGISIYDNRVQVPISSFLIVVISGLLFCYYNDVSCGIVCNILHIISSMTKR